MTLNNKDALQNVYLNILLTQLVQFDQTYVVSF